MTMYIMGIKETSLLSFHVLWIEMLILIISFYKRFVWIFFVCFSSPSECCFLFITVHVLWVMIYLCVLDLICFCGTLQFLKIWLKNEVQDTKICALHCQFPHQCLMTLTKWRSNGICLCFAITCNLIPLCFILRGKTVHILYCIPLIF